MRVETEPCTVCVDGWVCNNPNDPHARRDDVCHVCDGDTVTPTIPDAYLLTQPAQTVWTQEDADLAARIDSGGYYRTEAEANAALRLLEHAIEQQALDNFRTAAPNQGWTDQ